MKKKILAKLLDMKNLFEINESAYLKLKKFVEGL